MKKICIIGTGGFAREVLTLITDLGQYDNIDCFMEPDVIWAEKWKGKKIMGVDVKPQSEFNAMIHTATIAIGDSKIREKVVSQLPTDTQFVSLVHPSVVLSKWVSIGEGAIICAGSVVTCDIHIGKHVQLNLHSTVGHDCVIGDFFTTAPGAKISGACTIGKHVYLATLAGVRQGVKICDNVVIGMGAMVVKDITETGVYVGLPAKKII